MNFLSKNNFYHSNSYNKDYDSITRKNLRDKQSKLNKLTKKWITYSKYISQ